jgi:hypothetical protein
MNRGRRNQVIETAVRSVTEHLSESEARATLAQLPPGIPQFVRRPPGSPRSWTQFQELASARWEERERADHVPGGVVATTPYTSIMD